MIVNGNIQRSIISLQHHMFSRLFLSPLSIHNIAFPEILYSQNAYKLITRISTKVEKTQVLATITIHEIYVSWHYNPRKTKGPNLSSKLVDDLTNAIKYNVHSYLSRLSHRCPFAKIGLQSRFKSPKQKHDNGVWRCTREDWSDFSLQAALKWQWELDTLFGSTQCSKL